MTLRLIAVVPVALLICGCPNVPPPADPGGPSGDGIRFETVVDSADFPVAMAIAPDGRIFYTEKNTGAVRIVSNGTLLPDPFVQVPVSTTSERGLLGIALHPSFNSNGWVYLYYTRSSTGASGALVAPVDNRVVRFTASGSTAVGDEELILSLPAFPGPNHNGGNIHFGPDGKLYITIGDLTESSNSQNPDVLPGKILRINDNGSIPTDNPFGATNAAWALGLRNSFDFTFGPDGLLYATENSTNNHDEVNNIIHAGNYGWPDVQGRSNGTYEPDTGTYVEPMVDYTEGSAVPTGIAVAPDDTFGADSEGQLLVGEFNTGRIMRYTLNATRDGVISQTVFAQGISGGIVDLEFAEDGTLYVATTRQILRIVPDNG